MEFLKIRLEEGIGFLEMNHPPVNSITDQFANELMAAATSLARQDEARVVIVTSALDGIFMAGADIRMLREAVRANDFRQLEEAAVIKPAFNAIEKMPKPVIAAINGHAVGGGCELALACDFRLIAKGKRIGLTEVLLGLIPAAGGTQRIVRMLPRPIATRMLLEGTQLEAEEACRLGLVDKVVDPEKLIEETIAFARRFARGPALAYRALKRCIRDGSDGGFEEGLQLEKELFFELLGSEDVREGLSAFLEKRPAVFRGR